MVSAHLNGQIFASSDTGPYCFVGEEVIDNPFGAENHIQLWANSPPFRDPSLVKM